MTPFELSIVFFLQLVVLIVTCRIVGAVARLIGQPPVVSEMIAGVLLGPSLLGLIAPSAQARLFPPESMPVIYTVSQVGLALYMFLVGAEFRADLVASRLRSAATVSVAGIATPFVLGGAIAFWLAGDEGLFGPGVSRVEAMVFLGAAMSITAFPMLARIITERGLAGTALGTLALAAGSIDDAAAWCVLALVLASFGRDPSIAVLAIGGGVAYAALVLGVLRPALRVLARRVERTGGLGEVEFAFVLTLVMLGAYLTDAIGIYAVFGAFIMGAAVPRGPLVEELRRRIGPLTTTLLLPLFFVYSGLNTRIGLVSTPQLWMVAGAVMAAAIAGKGIACFAAARAAGEPPRTAVAVGALMNARGLMELIILNIGLERGIISVELFSIMVMMAIVTTLMATPIFELACGRMGSARRRALAPGPS
jgi:Kef-type K+ transport system membrane component KefB